MTIKVYCWYNDTHQLWESGDKDALNFRRINDGCDCVNVEAKFFQTKKQLNEFERIIEAKNKKDIIEIPPCPMNGTEEDKLAWAEKYIRIVPMSEAHIAIAKERSDKYDEWKSRQK